MNSNHAIHARIVLLTATLLSACASTPSDQVQHANIDGQWSLTLTIPAGSFDFAMTVQQTGPTFQCHLKNEQIDVDCAGTVEGDALKLAYDYSMFGMDMRVSYTGAVNDNEINGQLTSTSPDGQKLGDGTFTAKRL